MVYKVCLVRHGESIYNSLNVFTGWTDVDLTELGVLQALRAGNILRAHGVSFDLAYTSVLQRAVRTMWLVLGELGLTHITDIKSWRLNERHYGALQGLNKQETADKFGEEQVHQWRRGYAIRPPELSEDDPRHPRFDPRYLIEAGEESPYLPGTESLQDTVTRTLPFWHDEIVPAIKRGRNVLVAAHGNSLRGIVKHLDDISDEDVMGLEIPVGTPLMYELDEDTLKPVRHYYLGEHQVISSAASAAGSSALAQPSSWGLLNPPGPLLSGWLAGLRKVGLIKPLGLMQWSDAARAMASAGSPAPEAGEKASEAGGKADIPSTITEGTGTQPNPPTATAAATGAATGGGAGQPGNGTGDAAGGGLEGVVAMQDVAAVLQHSRFLLVDLTDLASALPPAQLLGRLSQQLDPAQHTLLLITSQKGEVEYQHHVPEDAPSEEEVLPMLQEAASHLSPHLRVLAVQLAPPAQSPAELTMGVARSSRSSGGGVQASGDDDANNNKPKAKAAPEQRMKANPTVIHPLSDAVQEEDVRRLELMLQYTGRPTTVATRTNDPADAGAAAAGAAADDAADAAADTSAGTAADAVAAAGAKAAAEGKEGGEGSSKKVAENEKPPQGSSSSKAETKEATKEETKAETKEETKAETKAEGSANKGKEPASGEKGAASGGCREAAAAEPAGAEAAAAR